MGFVTPQKINCDTVIVIIKSKSFHLKSKQTMKYDIAKPSEPKMPTPGNVTKRIQILL